VWVVLAAALLLASPAWAQKPWEQRVDIPVEIPLDLPAVALVNPFFAAVDAPPQLLEARLVKNFDGSYPVRAGIYVDAEGTCLRSVVLDTALPAASSAVTAELARTRFSPALLGGTAVPTWVTVVLELAGRIESGSFSRVRTLPLDPHLPPQLAPASAVVFERRDAQLPATAVEALDQLPLPRRFRFKTGSLSFSHSVRLLLEVTERGGVGRLIFLDCPTGLRNWLLASAANWSFQPAVRGGVPCPAWVILEATVAVETSSLATAALRVVGESPLRPAEP